MTCQESLCLIVQRCSKPCLFVSMSFREDGKGAKTFQEENLFHKTCLVQKHFFKAYISNSQNTNYKLSIYGNDTKEIQFKVYLNKIERKLIYTLKVAKRK